MDVTQYLELKPASRVLFDAAKVRGDQPRYFLPTASGWQPLLWRDHAEHIELAAQGLLGLGLQAGERAAIFAPNRYEWMEAALAIQAAGGVMVPVYASNTADQLAYVVNHSDARVLFVDSPALAQRTAQAWPQIRETVRQVVAIEPALCEALAPVGDALLTWADLSQRGAARREQFPTAIEDLVHNLSLDATAIMLYTSGTSGNPKGVPLTHRNIGVNGRDWLICNGPLVEEGDTDLLWLPMSHIFGYGEACLGNTLGFVTYLTDPMSVLTKLPEIKPHVFMSVPSVWEKLATTASRAADSKAKLLEITGGRMRFCLSGGAGLQRWVKEAFLAAGPLIIEGYGLTEASPTITLNRPDAFRFDTVGKPLPSVEVKLADDGEILARGASVFAGYHKDPEATRGVLTDDGWLLTGDVGRWTDDGFLQIIDRKKDILVTSGGKNIPPANIEMAFLDEPLIAYAVVYGDAKAFLVAGFWVNPLVADHLFSDKSLDDKRGATVERIEQKVAKVNAGLAKHETIKKWHLFDAPLTIEGGQLTPTLKVKRKRVCDEFKADFEALYAK